MVRSGEAAEPLAIFCAALRDLRGLAGQPPLAALRAEMSRRPGVSTLSDVLNAKITTAPDWGLVAEFVSACASLASRVLSPAVIDLGAWQRRHAELERQLEAIGRHARRNAAPAAVAVARTLPHGIQVFTGRERELARLMDSVAPARIARSVGIVAIDGMAGVGKTALAVHAAHLMAGRFPDGQLFVDLHAHTAGQSPVSPADALHALLPAVGVEPSAIPHGVDEQAALWRSTLASRRILLLLDNAVSHEQVRPLLPGAPGACVLITGRRRLAALDGAVMMPLDILSPAEAAELFVRASGTGDPDSAAVRELTRQVGYLPLAIRLLAGRLRSRPAWTVEDLVEELAAAKDRSAAIRAEDVVVGAVFDLSFDALPPRLKPLFRRLGLHLGVDFDVPVVAALAGVGEDEARQGLDVLYNDHLVEEPVRGRYRLHDLVRDYARGLASAETSTDTDNAISRLLAYYLDKTGIADRFVRGGTPDNDTLSTRADAVTWLDTELPNLVATIEQAASRHGTDVARLSHHLNRYLIRHGHWDHALVVHRTAYEAARAAADRAAEAEAARDLGALYYWFGGYDAAEYYLVESLTLSEELADREGRAETLAHLAVLRRMRGEFHSALEYATEASGMFEELGDRWWFAGVQTEVSMLQTHFGDYSAARETAAEALRASREINDRTRESTALRTLGRAQAAGGMREAAEATLTSAVHMARETGFRLGEADSLSYLGRVLAEAGRVAEAHAVLTEALKIFGELGNARGQALALNNLGFLARGQDPVVARRNHVLALRLAHAIQHLPGVAQAWEGVGRSLVAAGDVAGGIRRLRRALAIYHRLGDHDGRIVDAFITELEGGSQGEGDR